MTCYLLKATLEPVQHEYRYQGVGMQPRGTEQPKVSGMGRQ
ncbi:MAG: hypothetical protein WBN57_11555 [Gammaproteobacteria bacterium]